MADYQVITDDAAGLDRIVGLKSGAAVSVLRLGGELVSYRVRDPRSGGEVPLLYRDGDTGQPESGWKNHATILFPIVGGLKGKKSRLGDVVISSPRNHGFARQSVFQLKDKCQTDDFASLSYRLEANDETRRYYPFEFSLELVYTLQGSSLSLIFAVENREADKPIYFCFGWHPGFRTPIGDKGSKQDCQIIFPKGKVRLYHNTDECFLTGETTELNVGGPFAWTEEGLERTVMLEFDDPGMRNVILSDPVNGVDVKVDFTDFPHLGLWSEPGYPFICIEPWQGMDDHDDQEPFDKKVGVVRLEPGESLKREVKVTVEFA